MTDQKTASPEDEPANSRGRERPSQTQRVEMAAETDLKKNHASDSIKAAPPENLRSQSAFVDTAKAMAADPSTPLADKQAAGQANLLGRAEASAVKTFQTTVMDQIVDKAAMRSIHGRSEIQIRLKPEFLGNVQMNIAAEKAQLVVRIVTDQPVVKEIIETHLHQLKTELQSQGLTIDKFEVMVNPDAHQQQSRDQFAQMFKNHSFRNGRRQPAEQDPEGLNRRVGDVFDDAPANRDGVNYFA
ncbi:flagellar hook-length control protein FliK [Desulfosarcina sp.]|uniref:flagellar hook-length control protein FliK n=1 Tax=Desulfosarcina sp. TaxID=2027861 RepID=UPI003970CFFB